MKQRTVRTLYAYWNDIRAGRLAPRRLEIEPARIGSVLPETFMLERTTSASYRYRLAGTRLCEIFGTELRSTDFMTGWMATDHATIAGNLRSTCEQGAATLLTVEAGADTARRVQLEVIMLPLMHSNNTVERIIGAMSPLSSPHWLGYEHLSVKRLIDHELIWPDGRPHAILERTGREPHFRPALAMRSGKAERRLFRVLDGGRGKG